MQKGTILLAVLLASGLPGCDSYSEHRLQQQVARTVRHNPKPQHGYRLTLTLHDAPGPFQKVEGVVQYTVENHHSCGYKAPITKIVISSHSELIHLPLEKVSDTEYTGIIYTDLLLDDNYYGRETCHWQLLDARTLVRATGIQKETTFITEILYESIISQGGKTQYYWKARYPYSNIYDPADYGSPDPDRFIPEARNDLFSITLMAREIAL
ncbi:MAG: hypothetical protein LBL59_10275 [Xanthomonadaceae bacterium]|nr:hypothetical protein [Xanthomonadaceae bacterium]